jgi:hypothetical protein
LFHILDLDRQRQEWERNRFLVWAHMDNRAFRGNPEDKFLWVEIVEINVCHSTILKIGITGTGPVLLEWLKEVNYQKQKRRSFQTAFSATNYCSGLP